MKLFCSLILSCFTVFAVMAENLVGPIDADGKPSQWNRMGDTTISSEDGKVTIVINGKGRASRRIMMKPEWKYLKLSVSIRTDKLVPGEKGWQNGRLAMNFYKAEKEVAGPELRTFGSGGTTPAHECVRVYAVPEDAVWLTIAPSNFGKSGLVEFSNIRLEPITSLDDLDQDATPPGGATEEALWTLNDAFRNTNAYRESVSLNGLWRFSPTAGEVVPPVGSGWGWFKVPGIWPGRKGVGDSQIIRMADFATPFDPATLNTAWYRRKVQIPDTWNGRKIELEITMLQTCAQVFVDGKTAGEFYYPGGKLDLTKVLAPGKEHDLALRVSAIPDESAKQVYMAPGRLIESSGELNCRGITGDVFLHSYPLAGHVTDAHMIALLKAGKLVIDAGLAQVKPGRYFLEAEIRDGAKVETKFKSPEFSISTNDGTVRRMKFETNWVAPKLWDIDTPDNLYYAEVWLKTATGGVVDLLFAQEFGYREFRIEGRNFLLNGTPIHLRSLYNDTIKKDAQMSCAQRERNLAMRAKQSGFNHLIGYDYNFTPGTVGYVDAFYRETSRIGVLTSMTMPHAKDFDWKLEDPAQAERYRVYAESRIRRLQNLPGVVFYSTSHNATGYSGDQNPQRLDGIYAPEKYGMDTLNPTRFQQRQEAMLAARIIQSIDPSRPIYHHESGNLGDIMTLNCYLNWAPRQERSDWLETWEQSGVKPLIMVEWGMPHVASWSSHRGPGFIWSSPAVQCVWFNEFDAAILGEEAYRSNEGKNKQYRHEFEMAHGNRPVMFVKLNLMSNSLDSQKVCAWMVADNFRSLRARGLSGLLPWDQGRLWERRGKGTIPKFDPLGKLKQPGIVPDTMEAVSRGMIFSFDNFVPSLVGKEALQALRPEIGWIAGRVGDFSEKGHNFRPGETVRKQLLVLNDTRRDRTVECTWSIKELALSGKGTLTLRPGSRGELPVEFEIPERTPAGELELKAEFRFEDNSIITDKFALQVVPKNSDLPKGKVGLYDPFGYSAPIFEELGLTTRAVHTQADLNGLDILVIGREGLRNFPLRLSKSMRSGLKLLVLEQGYPELTRFGFRSNIHGLRQVFALDGSASVRDWRGASTLIAPFLETPELETTSPTWNWNGFANTRVWRAGNRASVNSVLLEKPSVGDFLPLYQGGFDLQYAPALLWNQQVIFCQFDVSGRTESDPEAMELVRSMLLRLDGSQPNPALTTYYAGDARGSDLLKQLNIRFSPVPDKLPDDALLVIGPGAKLTGVAEAVERGLSVLAIGLDKAELEWHFPGYFQAEPGKFFSDYVDNLPLTKEFSGISNSELHWRVELPMASFDARSPGGRALQVHHAGRGTVVAVQIAPWMIEEKEQAYRTTRRRTQFLVSRLLHNLRAESKEDGFELLDGSAPNGGATPLTSGWIGRSDPNGQGRKLGWFQPKFKSNAEWKSVKVNMNFERQFQELKDYDGLFWYRLDFELPEELRGGSSYTINLGAIDDESWVWLNGKFLGEVTKQSHPTNYWAYDRSYTVDGSLLKANGNVLVVLCNDLKGNGGLYGKPEIRSAPRRPFYADKPQAVDDPYRYYRW